MDKGGETGYQAGTERAERGGVLSRAGIERLAILRLEEAATRQFLDASKAQLDPPEERFSRLPPYPVGRSFLKHCNVCCSQITIRMGNVIVGSDAAESECKMFGNTYAKAYFISVRA